MPTGPHGAHHDRYRTAQKVDRLLALLEGRSSALIVMQDYPDPDAIAAAAAFKELANAKSSVQCSLVHGGIVGRAENRALVQYLGLNLRGFEDVDATRFDLVVMVDTQPGTGNNSLAASVIPHVVIDHHPIRRLTRRADMTDVRGKYGAASTILFEYLACLNIVPEPPLATALAYGIRSDTQDLGRETTQSDIHAYLALYHLSNKRMLREIRQWPVPKAYFQMLALGLANARVFGPCVVTGLGDIDNPDMIGEIADMLLRKEGAVWSLCYGYSAGKILMSLRTSDADANAGRIMHRVAGRRGTGGGHGSFAGGQIPLRNVSQWERRQIEATILRRFLRVTGVKSAFAEKLVE